MLTTRILVSRLPRGQALGHRPRHHLQPHGRARRAEPRLRPDIPARQDGQHQGGVRQVARGHGRRHRLGHRPRRLGPAVVRRRRPHQRHRHPQLQGRCLPGRPDLCRHERADCALSCPVSGPFSGFRLANLASPNTSSSARSLSRSAQPSRSASTSSPSCSRRSACLSS